MRTNIYLIRHAQSEMNLTPEIICGQSISAILTGKGVTQAIGLNKRLLREGLTFDGVYASTADRALTTASIATHGMGVEIISDERLLELHQGDFEGKNRYQTITPSVLEQILKDEMGFKPPNGESKREVGDRMMDFISEVIEKKEHEHAGIFGHGFAFKCLLQRILNFDPCFVRAFRLENTSITKISFDTIEESWRFHYFNSYSHLRL